MGVLDGEGAVRWSVGIEAEGDRVLVVEEVVETEAISEHEELDELSGGPR
jgi:hypothetical protein